MGDLVIIYSRSGRPLPEIWRGSTKTIRPAFPGASGLSWRFLDQHGDVAVAQVKYSFNNFLFGYFDGSLFSSFIDNGFDFILRNITFRRRFDRKNYKKNYYTTSQLVQS